MTIDDALPTEPLEIELRAAVPVIERILDQVFDNAWTRRHSHYGGLNVREDNGHRVCNVCGARDD